MAEETDLPAGSGRITHLGDSYSTDAFQSPPFDPSNLPAGSGAAVLLNGIVSSGCPDPDWVGVSATGGFADQLAPNVVDGDDTTYNIARMRGGGGHFIMAWTTPVELTGYTLKQGYVPANPAYATWGDGAIVRSGWIVQYDASDLEATARSTDGDWVTVENAESSASINNSTHAFSSPGPHRRWRWVSTLQDPLFPGTLQIDWVVREIIPNVISVGGGTTTVIETFTWDSGEEFVANPYPGGNTQMFSRTTAIGPQPGALGTPYCGGMGIFGGDQASADVACIAGKTYRFSGFSQGYGESWPSTDHGIVNFSWGVRWYNSSGGVVRTDVVGSHENAAQDGPFLGPDTADLVAPTGADHFRIGQGFASLPGQPNNTKIDELTITEIQGGTAMPCGPQAICEDMDPLTVTSLPTPNGNCESSGGWSGGGYLDGEILGHGGAKVYGTNPSFAPFLFRYDWPSSVVLEPGVTYIARVDHATQGGIVARFGTAAESVTDSYHDGSDNWATGLGGFTSCISFVPTVAGVPFIEFDIGGNGMQIFDNLALFSTAGLLDTVTLNYASLSGYGGGGTSDVESGVVTTHSGLDYNFWLLYDFSDQGTLQWRVGTQYRLTFEYTGWGIGTMPFYFGHCTVNPASSAFLYRYPEFTPNPNPLFDDAVYAELAPLPDDSSSVWTKVTFTWTPQNTYAGGVYVLFGRREGTSGYLHVRDAVFSGPAAAAAVVSVQGSGTWQDYD